MSSLRAVRLGIVASIAFAAPGCAVLQPRCAAESTATDAIARSASCVVVVEGRLLAIRHRFGGKLGLPGGGAHRGEAPRCTAERETWEETGVAVRALEPVGPVQPHGIVFHCEPRDMNSLPRGIRPPLHALPEVLGIHWLQVDELQHDSWRFPAQLVWLPTVLRTLGQQAATGAGCEGR
jgi:8-oxo-dGTP pyrophosphatase MutT (NUDIX family)